MISPRHGCVLLVLASCLLEPAVAQEGAGGAAPKAGASSAFGSAARMAMTSSAICTGVALSVRRQPRLPRFPERGPPGRPAASRERDRDRLPRQVGRALAHRLVRGPRRAPERRRHLAKGRQLPRLRPTSPPIPSPEPTDDQPSSLPRGRVGSPARAFATQVRFHSVTTTTSCKLRRIPRGRPTSSSRWRTHPGPRLGRRLGLVPTVYRRPWSSEGPPAIPGGWSSREFAAKSAWAVFSPGRMWASMCNLPRGRRFSPSI